MVQDGGAPEHDHAHYAASRGRGWRVAWVRSIGLAGSLFTCACNPNPTDRVAPPTLPISWSAPSEGRRAGTLTIGEPIEVAFHPSERRLAVVVERPGPSHELWLVDPMETERSRLLAIGITGQQFSSPRWSRAGDRLYFSTMGPLWQKHEIAVLEWPTSSNDPPEPGAWTAVTNLIYPNWEGLQDTFPEMDRLLCQIGAGQLVSLDMRDDEPPDDFPPYGIRPVFTLDSPISQGGARVSPDGKWLLWAGWTGSSAPSKRLWLSPLEPTNDPAPSLLPVRRARLLTPDDPFPNHCESPSWSERTFPGAEDTSCGSGSIAFRSGADVWMTGCGGERFLRLAGDLEGSGHAGTSWSVDGGLAIVVGAPGNRRIEILDVDVAVQRSQASGDLRAVSRSREFDLESMQWPLPYPAAEAEGYESNVETRFHLASTLFHLGDLRGAETAIQTARRIEEACAGPRCLHVWPLMAARLRLIQGDIEEAANLAGIARDGLEMPAGPRCAPDLNAIKYRAEVFGVLAESQGLLGDSQKALEAAQGAVRDAKFVWSQRWSRKKAERPNLELLLIRALNTLGISFRRASRVADAREAFSNAIDQAKSLLKDQSTINEVSAEWSLAIANLADLDRKDRHTEVAVRRLEEALARAVSAGDARIVSICSTLLAQALEEAGRDDDALNMYGEAESRALSAFDRWTPRLGRGRILSRQKSAEEALSALLGALHDVEIARAWMTLDRYRLLYLAERRNVYEELLQLLARRAGVSASGTVGQSPSAAAKEAFLVSEGAHGRALLDGLVESRHGSPRVDIDPEMDSDLRRGLWWLGLSEPSASDAAVADAAPIERAADALGKRTVENAEAALKRLRTDGTLLLEFFVGDRTYLLSVAEAVSLYDLGETAGIEAAVRTFLEQLGHARRVEDITASRGAVRERLLSRVEESLSQHERILIVPDGVLWQVPFEVLLESDRITQDTSTADRTIWYAPSAASYWQIVSGSAVRDAARLGPPSLLAIGPPRDETGGLSVRAQEEANTIGRCITSPVRLVDAKAREASIHQYFHGTRLPPTILHFATHATVGASHLGDDHLALGRGNPPESSGSPGAARSLPRVPGDSIVLSSRATDGMLNPDEILASDVRGDLVVLSACDSARGTAVPGEGIVGLARAFIMEGASSVVGTQRKIDTSRAKAVMTDFYEQLCKGATVAEALRAARRACRAERHGALHHCESFILIGDPDFRPVRGGGPSARP